MKPKNRICLRFDKEAHESARFYATTFSDGEVTVVHSAPCDYLGGKEGDVLTVEFTVLGVPCLGLNGGQVFRHSEAFSFEIVTDNQEETDRYWNAIVGNLKRQWSAAGSTASEHLGFVSPTRQFLVWRPHSPSEQVARPSSLRRRTGRRSSRTISARPSPSTSSRRWPLADPGCSVLRSWRVRDPGAPEPAWAASSCEISTWTSATASFAVADSFIDRFFLRRLSEVSYHEWRKVSDTSRFEVVAGPARARKEYLDK
jgi:predicted 3-demethylubiquinone-9 3-methyltransferase (glyoxalase superfamily)